MKVVIYTRVSTDEQARSNLSLKGQKDAALKYCADNDIQIAAIFTDEGESAKTADRPQLLAALDYCKKNYKEIDGFVVWKLDRLARKSADHHVITAVLKKHGVRLISVTEPIDDSATGQLMETILAGYAQFDNDVRAERSGAGVLRRIQEGGWPHLAPLGYINVKDDLKRPTLEPDENAPIIAKWLLEYLKGGYTQYDMNGLAWKMGVRSRLGKRLSYQQTCNMLRSPIYAGQVYSKMLDYPIRGLHEPLITLEDHLLILDRLDGRKKPRSGERVNKAWPLRGGFVICNICGASLTGSAPKGRSKHYPIYSCPNCRAKNVGHRVSVDREAMHAQFEDLLLSITPSEVHLKLFREVFVKKWQKAHLEQRRRIQELQGELERLEERKGRVVDMFIDGQLTPEEKREQTSRIESDRLRTELKLSEMKTQAVDSDTLIDFGINMIKNAPKLWRIANEIERRRLQLAIFPEGLRYDFINGFGTAKLSGLYDVIQQVDEQNIKAGGGAWT